MHNFQVQVNRLIQIFKILFEDKIDSSLNFYKYPNMPLVPDLEILAIGSVPECFQINSENHLFTILDNEIPGFLRKRISRPRFNIRRRNLQVFMEEAFSLAKSHFMPDEKVFIVDSKPVPDCRLGRISRLKVCKEDPHVRPQLATCYAKNEKYYGFKLHLITTQKGCPVAFSLTGAKTHDVKAFEDMMENTTLKKVDILGDKGYVSDPLQLHLFDQKEVNLNAQPRINMKTPLNWTPKMSAIRKRIEIVFSQIEDQFRIDQNFAKTIKGLVVRLTHKLVGLLFCQLSNIQKDRNLRSVKSALFS